MPELSIGAGPCVPGWETGRPHLYCKAVAIKTLNLVGKVSDVYRGNGLDLGNSSGKPGHGARDAAPKGT